MSGVQSFYRKVKLWDNVKENLKMYFGGMLFKKTQCEQYKILICHDSECESDLSPDTVSSEVQSISFSSQASNTIKLEFCIHNGP